MSRNDSLAVENDSSTQAVRLERYLSDPYELPEPALPDLGGSQIDPASAAGYVRAAWGLGDVPVQSMLDTVEANGVRVFALPDETGVEVDAFSFWQDDTPFMLVSTAKTSERLTFDLAHELGHLILHRDHDRPAGRDREREADAFASHFLMPANDVCAQVRVIPSLEDIAIMKHRWGVSTAALNYRLHSLQLISDWHYRQICIELAKRGRHNEPNPGRGQHSSLLTAISRLVAEDSSWDQVSAETNIPRADIEDLFAGLTLSLVHGDGLQGPKPERPPTLRLV